MSDAPDAIQSAAIYHKLAERKHTLCGLNPVTGYAVQVMHTEAAPHREKTTTDELEAAIARIRASKLEKPLLEEPSTTH